MSSPVIVGIGEVLWDLFPDSKQFGGAPANFAAHAASLGARSYVISRVGEDELGRKARAAIIDNGVASDFLQSDPQRATGSVQIELADNGSATYEFADDTAWDHLIWDPRLADLAHEARAVCFGTLGQRSPVSRQTIRRFLESTSPGCLRVFDVNLRQNFYDSETIRHSLQNANLFKLNEEELPVVADLCGLSSTGEAAISELLQRFELQMIALTEGSAGAQLYTPEQHVSQAAVNVPVQDTVGAGDAFTAALTMGLLAGNRLEVILQHAVKVAAYVCTQAGATPRLPAELINRGEGS